MGKPRIGVAKPGHLGLKFLVGHARGLAIDEAKVGLGDLIGKGVAVRRRGFYDEAAARGVPFFCLVLLLGVLRLEIIQLLALDSVLVFRFLGGAGDACRE